MKNIKKALLVLLIFVLTVGGVISASASTVNIKMSLEDKAMKTIKKTGTYKLNNRTYGKNGYVKFKAPKTGTYEFTFKNVSYDGEKEDMNTSDYWNTDYYSYDRTIKVSLQHKNNNYWKNIKFNNGRDEFRLTNLRQALSSMQYVSYDLPLNEIYEKYKNGEISNEDISDSLDSDNSSIDITLSVKMKKNTLIRILTTGDLKKSYCILNIKKK